MDITQKLDELDKKVAQIIVQHRTSREYIPALQGQAERIKPLEEKIVASQHSVEVYLDSSLKLLDENRRLRDELRAGWAQVQEMDRLLWWVTALACQSWPGGVRWDVFDRLIRPLIQALVTQGYTQEALEKR